MRKAYRVPIALVVVALVALPVVALVEVPGERDVKEALGFDYKVVQKCGDIRHRGREGGPWRTEPALNGPRDEARAAVVGRSAYLVGGLDDLDLSVDPGTASSVATFQRYDFDSRRYVDLPPLPERLNHVGVATYHGDIYVAGGHNDQLGRAEATDAAWRYRVKQRRWEEIEPMPTPRGGHDLVVVGDRMYALGGRLGSQRLDTNEAYDFRTGKWTARAPMPTGRDHFGAVAYRGKIYTVGGRRNEDYSLGAFELYDPRRDRWSKLPDIPEPISSMGLVEIDGKLVTVGGSDALEIWVSGRAWSYYPDRRDWSELPPSPEPKHGYAAAAFDGRMYLFGGSRCGAFRATETVESLRVPRA